MFTTSSIRFLPAYRISCVQVVASTSADGKNNLALIEEDSENNVIESFHKRDEIEGVIANSPQKEDDKSDGTNETNILHLYSDVGYWSNPLSHDLRIDMIQRGSEGFQHQEDPFQSVQRAVEKLKGETRQLTTIWFYKQLPNEETLFNTNEEQAGTSKFVTGFQTWWKLNLKVFQHESSEQHAASLEKWKTLGAQLKLNETIDEVSLEIQNEERKKWNDILHCLLDVTLFLAKQNLAFRGHREHQNSTNRGNFLELVELFSPL
ncbi:hypothetical protein ILUMI_11122 [Ignelater luminosus]|uniref:DUF4371 domain-containing protein n=1 Tax=Ignelater luminosus TaxID=2038154 RepID=A0A8K0D130_IGNLU|nr:hypothetical protein ILUMI_11122 [Ignelater luminosus]